MKKLLILFISVFAISGSYAQTLPPLSRYNLDTEEGCVAADEIALQVADFLYASPMITDDEKRLHAARFLNRWMEGTPTYEFMIDDRITRYFDNDPDMMDMYMAALTRYQLRNPGKTEDEISIGALKQMLDYADNPDNIMLLHGRMQKLAEAYNKGKLENIL